MKTVNNATYNTTTQNPVKVERLGESALVGSPMEEVVASWQKYEQLTRDVNALSIQFSNTRKASDKLLIAASKSSLGPEVLERISSLRQGLDALDTRLNGNPAKNEIGRWVKPTIGSRLFALNRGIATSTYSPLRLRTGIYHRECLHPGIYRWD